MKAILESLTEFYLIIVAFAVLALIFSIVFTYAPFFEGPQQRIEASSENIAKTIAEKAMECWSKHRYGLDRESEVCFSLDIKTDGIVTEEMITKYLDCNKLPNNPCGDKTCDCVSKNYMDQDKIRSYIQNNETVIKISYDGNEGKISLLDINAIFISPIEPDADTCQNAQDKNECDNLDAIYGSGYKAACCKQFRLCCPIKCLDHNENTYDPNAICCSNLELKRGLVSDLYTCCKPNECASEGCLPDGTTRSTNEGNFKCENGVWNKIQECSPEKLINFVDEDIVMENLRYLTQHSRPYGSSWNEQTADYISDKLKSYGLNVRFEDFVPYGRNVVAEIGDGDNVIVVSGGHRDSVSVSPGAVDNAAGTVTVMEAARVISSCKELLKKNKLRFVLFDGEERGLLGSYAYVREHSENIKRMLNFDCVGYEGSTGLTVFRTADDLSDSADSACQSIGITCYKEGQAGCNSDHCPFGEAGISYLWAIDSCGKCYHKSCDDMTQIDSEKLGMVGKFAVYVLSDLYLK